MIIRRGNVEDLPRLITLGRDMHNESIYKDIEWDDDIVHNLGMAAIHDNRYLLLVAETEEDGIIGFFLGFYTTYFFSRECIAQDMALFVSSDKRGYMAAKKLIDEYTLWAIRIGCREVCLASSTGINPAKTGALFERLGFNHIGGIYKQRLS